MFAAAISFFAIKNVKIAKNVLNKKATTASIPLATISIS